MTRFNDGGSYIYYIDKLGKGTTAEKRGRRAKITYIICPIVRGERICCVCFIDKWEKCAQPSTRDLYIKRIAFSMYSVKILKSCPSG